jgi:hypothetical protein
MTHNEILLILRFLKLPKERLESWANAAEQYLHYRHTADYFEKECEMAAPQLEDLSLSYSKEPRP